jgi:hypothetical protein
MQLTYVRVATGAIIAVPIHLMSITDLRDIDKEGQLIKKPSCAVDVALVESKTAKEVTV